MSITQELDDLASEYRKLRQVGFTGYYQMEQAKKIGKDLFKEGGNKKMHDTCMNVSEDTEGFLNAAWDGIGHWVA